MDNLSMLEALMGDQSSVHQDSDAVQFYPRVKAYNIYEGTDSEDDEVITSGKAPASTAPVKARQQELRVEDYIEKLVPDTSNLSETSCPSNDFTFGAKLELGQIAKEGERFCSLMAIKRYPYCYIGVANKQKVAEGFFDQGKFMTNTWDLYYIHRSLSNIQNQPIILVSTKQFEAFLQVINTSLNIRLTIPAGANGAYSVHFTDDGTPQPRYLGRSNSSQEADYLKMNVPPNSYRIKGERKPIQPEDRSLASYLKKIELLSQAAKGKKEAHKQKQKAERIIKQQSWCNSIKRVQRYLGLRETRQGDQVASTACHSNIDHEVFNGNATDSTAAAQLAPTTFNPTIPSPFAMERDVIFVSVDVEAYERDNSKITEVGVSTLDTREIAGLPPGVGGTDWFKAIQSRHFRIKEYKHLNNSKFVDGCADRFEFGTSEFISIKDVPIAVTSCLAPRLPTADHVASAFEHFPKRHVILVGHDVKSDVNFLRSIGYDIYDLSNLVEEVDTASMWRYCTRDSQPRNLGSILAELQILGWNLHNAGNDATYTLQAMIAMSIKHIVDKQKARAVQDAEKAKRISEIVAEATVTAIEREEGWSSGGSDGGDPVPPYVAESPKDWKQLAANGKPFMSASNRASNMEGSWRSPERPNKWASDKKLDTWSQDTAPSKAQVITSGWGNLVPASVLPWSTSVNVNDTVAESKTKTNNTGGWGITQLQTNPTLPNEVPDDGDESGALKRSAQWGRW